MRRIIITITLFMMFMSLTAQTHHEWRDSVSVYARLIEQNPTNIDLRLKKAAANIELGQWQYALDEYSDILQLDKENITALYFRAFVYNQMSNHAFARRDYEEALKLDPTNDRILIGLIATNVADKRMQKAFEDVNMLLERTPEKAEAWALRSEIEINLQMNEAALEDILKAIEIERQTSESRYPLTIDDDMTNYQLTAFGLYQSMNNPRKAKVCLDYLVKNGIPRMALIDYYSSILQQ